MTVPSSKKPNKVIIEDANTKPSAQVSAADGHGAMGIGGTPINRVVLIEVTDEFQDDLIGPDDEARKCWCLGDTTKKVVGETQESVLIVLI